MLAAASLLTCLATPAAAQDSNPNTGDLHVSGALDFTNAYMFRGIRQETDGLLLQPYLDVGLTLYKGEGTVKNFGLNFGTWNSLHHRAPTGSDNPVNRKAWYESDFYATLGFTVTGGVTVGVTYTAYTSPNSQFTTVKEAGFKFSVDDSKWLGRFSLKPYGLIASEFDTGTGTGQADAGFCQGTTISGCVGAGTYIEIGGAPTYAFPRWSLSVPLKGGFGLIDYYQAVYTDPDTGRIVSLDSKFGFFSIAAIGTYPLTAKAGRLGSWNVHGGVEYQRLGEMPKYANGGDADQVIGTIGLGFSY